VAACINGLAVSNHPHTETLQTRGCGCRSGIRYLTGRGAGARAGTEAGTEAGAETGAETGAGKTVPPARKTVSAPNVAACGRAGARVGWFRALQPAAFGGG
jgi:2-keto-3-deoxy-galactonokinase